MWHTDSVNKLVLGGNIFGHFTDENETIQILNTARDLGVLSVDTADVYSGGYSEEILGRQLQADRKKWFVATKVGLESGADPSRLGQRNRILSKLEGSLRRLRTDYIDLYQIHHFDPITPLEETIECFEDLMREGKILGAGISNYNLPQLRQLVEKKHPFTYSQLPVNLCNYSSVLNILSLSEEHKISVIAYSALARGLLNEKYLFDTIPDQSRVAGSKNIRNELTGKFKNRLSITRDLCVRSGLTVPHLALVFLGCTKQVKKIIVGVRDSDQLISSVKGIGNKISKELFESAVEIWSTYEQTG